MNLVEYESFVDKIKQSLQTFLAEELKKFQDLTQTLILEGFGWEQNVTDTINELQVYYHQENFETLEAPGTQQSVKKDDPGDKVSDIQTDSYNKIQEENYEDEVCFETENKLIHKSINNENQYDKDSNKYFENDDMFNMNERKIQTTDKILKLLN